MAASSQFKLVKIQWKCESDLIDMCFITIPSDILTVRKKLSILTTGIWQKLWERKTKHWNKSKGNHKLATVFEEFWLNLWPDESLKPGLKIRQIFLRILVSESEPRTNCSNHVRTGRMRSVEGSGVSSGVLLPRMGLDATISLEMKPQKPNPDPESENAKRVIKSNMVIDRCIVT